MQGCEYKETSIIRAILEESISLYQGRIRRTIKDQAIPAEIWRIQSLIMKTKLTGLGISIGRKGGQI
jgi:hypothetical protein